MTMEPAATRRIQCADLNDSYTYPPLEEMEDLVKQTGVILGDPPLQGEQRQKALKLLYR